jgi:single-stranded DNA-binding protein
MNKIELLGRLNWLDIKYYDSGTCVTKILLARKLPNKDEYESFPIAFFNTKNDNTAERLAEECKHGDYIRIVGKLRMSTYTTKDNRKQSKLEIIGWNFVKVQWDAEQNKYVDIGDGCDDTMPEEEQEAA